MHHGTNFAHGMELSKESEPSYYTIEDEKDQLFQKEKKYSLSKCLLNVINRIT